MYDRHPPWTVSVSDVLTGTKCRRKQHLRRRGVEVRLPELDRPDVRGSVIHEGLSAAFQAGVVDQSLIDNACFLEYRNKGGTAAAPIDALREWCTITGRAARAFPVNDWEPVYILADDGVTLVPLIEQRIFVNLADPGRGTRMHLSLDSYQAEHGYGPANPALSFKPDAVLRHKASGNIWLCDHKTRASLGSYFDWTEEHLQSLVYWRCLAPWLSVNGAFLYQIHAEVPKTPHINKPEKGEKLGRVSTRACVTDWETAKQAIAKSINPDPDHAEYEWLRMTCAARVWQYAQQVEGTRASLDEALRHIQLQFAAGVTTGADSSPTGRGHACQGCEYTQWCARTFRGEDPSVLLGELYIEGAMRMSETPHELGRDPRGPRDQDLVAIGTSDRNTQGAT